MRKLSHTITRLFKKTSSLYQLDPFLDANGTLRVGGRIRRPSLSYGAKHPIILPRKGHMTELNICHHHRIVEHQGRGITHSEIRSAGYWVIGGSSAVSNHDNKGLKLLGHGFLPKRLSSIRLPSWSSAPITIRSRHEFHWCDERTPASCHRVEPRKY